MNSHELQVAKKNCIIFAPLRDGAAALRPAARLGPVVQWIE